MTDGFGPGIPAFVTFLILAIVLWFLMRNMNARLRRMSYADRTATPGTAGDPARSVGPAGAVEADRDSGAVEGPQRGSGGAGDPV